jgi:hypothetical protein
MAADIDYVSVQPPTNVAEAFRAFCERKRLAASNAEEESLEVSDPALICIRPGERYSGKFESSYLYLSAKPSSAGSRVTLGEVDLN